MNEYLTLAKDHLAKAREFLEAAELNDEFELYSAAVSNAVTSGINSKDAICLKLTRRTAKTDDHSAAPAELKASGPLGASLAPTLTRLLGLKPRAQYQSKQMTNTQAASAVGWAQRLYEGAEGVLNS